MSGHAIEVLLIDDDIVDAMNVRRALAKAQLPHTLRVAQDGVEALALLRRGPTPASGWLVLLDLNLPRMNGLELLRTLREDPNLCTIRVVVLTTSNDEHDRSATDELGVSGYLLKPVGHVDLAVALSEALGSP